MNIIPQNEPPLKRCTECGIEFPATTDFFHRDKSRKDGLTKRCKTCVLAYHTVYRTRPGIAERQQAYLQVYCHRPEYSQARKARRASDPEFRKRDGERSMRWFYAHHDDALAKNRKRSREYRKRPDIQTKEREYHKARRQIPAVKDRSRAYVLARIARKKAAGGTITASQIREKLKAQHFACYYCQAKLEKRNGRYVYHMDHTIPLSRAECGPRHDVNYVVLACPRCNQSKGNKLPHEWPEGGRLF